jgi:hypothetical protein
MFVEINQTKYSVLKNRTLLKVFCASSTSDGHEPHSGHPCYMKLRAALWHSLLLPLLSVHPVIPFQFLPPHGAVVCFLLWSSLLKGRYSPFRRRSNNFRFLNLFSWPSDSENRHRPDSFPVGQALRDLLVCLYLFHIQVYYYYHLLSLLIIYSVQCCYSTLLLLLASFNYCY